METTDHPLSGSVDLDGLAKELSRLLKVGLPVTDRTAGTVLPHLRNVVARSIHPGDAISRIDSLNTILSRLLTDFDHDRYSQPARILFGLAPGMAGTTLTIRRQHAAQHLGYDLDHFRKRVEPQAVRAVAELVYRDMLRYKKRVTGGDKFSAYPVWALTAEDITVEEELSSIVWHLVYGIRSELIGARRHENEPGYETRTAEHYDRAARLSVGLQKAIDNYRHLFGPIIRLMGVEYRAEAVETLMRLPNTETRRE